ncbi:uracil-DNA glycosylase [Sedimentibacter sp. zth1]|uniref:uracil-DNA glycosylase n=1 Tax=Sedimentibacter sp. zth1 TaxID=2816908 RepID=UPI001A92FA16|nr:uracil-DNA glycosylase [Sedimentibacter sp. zth1]QSX05579.1 uracil-DNA glycosylase [Sedimentibacter sp. zth1]
MKLLNSYHSSWNEFLTEERINEINQIEKEIGDNINPEKENVLRFLNLNLDEIKVVILGQDPYPEKGRATGRAFEVGDLNDWNQKFRQVSLKNIVRLIHKNYNNIENYEDIFKFSNIQKQIRDNKFNIRQPNVLFKCWENQGVMLLNTYFSVEAGKPGSHIKIWQSFSQELLRYISSKNPSINWFLWGKQAEEKSQYIISGTKYISRHPMMCSSKYDDDFLKSSCFKKTMQTINWLG